MNEIHNLVAQIRSDLDKFTKESTERLNALEHRMLQIDPSFLISKLPTNRSNLVTANAGSASPRPPPQLDVDVIDKKRAENPSKRVRTANTSEENNDETPSKKFKTDRSGKESQSTPILVNDNSNKKYNSSSNGSVSVVALGNCKVKGFGSTQPPGISERDGQHYLEIGSYLNEFCDYLRQHLCEKDMYAVTKTLEYEDWYGAERFQAIPNRQVPNLIRSFRNSIKSTVYTFIRHILDLDPMSKAEVVKAKCQQLLQDQLHINDGKKQLHSNVLGRALAVCLRGHNSPAKRHSWTQYPPPVIAFTINVLTHVLGHFGTENSVIDNPKKVYEDAINMIAEYSNRDFEGFDVAMNSLFKLGDEYEDKRIWRGLKDGGFVTRGRSSNSDFGSVHYAMTDA